MAVVTFILPSKYTVLKKRSRKKRESKVAPARHTLTQEVKDWLSECVKTHWFLHEPVQRHFYKNQDNHKKVDYQEPNKYDLHISFQDASAAALFKLTWL